MISKFWWLLLFILSFKSKALYHCIQGYNEDSGQLGGHRKILKIKLAAIVTSILNNMWEFMCKSVLSGIVALIL